MKKAMKLSPKHRLFVAEYLANGFNATAACEAAGYSAKTAYSQGPRMLTHPGVSALINERLGGQLAALGLKAERVLLELARVGYADLGEAFGLDGQLLDLKEMPDGIRRALAGVDSEQLQGDDGPRGTVLKIRTHDKLRALELLGKHLKLWVDKGEAPAAETLLVEMLAKYRALPAATREQIEADLEHNARG